MHGYPDLTTPRLQTVNNTRMCDSIAQLLDHCFLYTPELDAVNRFLTLNPHEKLHAIRPKCSMLHGRDHFDRYMSSIILDLLYVPICYLTIPGFYFFDLLSDEVKRIFYLIQREFHSIHSERLFVVISLIPRFMINLDSYSLPEEKPTPLRKYDKVLSCGEIFTFAS